MPKGGVTLSLFWRLTFRGRGQVPAEIEWRHVTLVKRFAGSAETLTAIQLTSRRDDWKRGAQPPRMRSEQHLMKSVWRAECWKELQGRMSMWASLCPPVCPSTVSLPLDLPLRVLKRVTVWHHPNSPVTLGATHGRQAPHHPSGQQLRALQTGIQWLTRLRFTVTPLHAT